MRRTKRLHSIRTGLGHRTVVFVGMMGCGKSAIGRLLASELELPFHDSDAEIVEAAGMPIAEIFSRFGEDYFRKGEQRVISRLLSEGPGVLSLGGGAFLAANTREEIAQKGISIWLKADIDLLLARVMRRPGTRPLLQTADPRATLADLLDKRTPFYEQADLHVESSRLSKKMTCENVVRSLAAWLPDHPALAQEETGE
ncbi:MAG: shikimate kinase [Nitratireductor sp.]|nr:shikimate kinase [Nitratireductor sp.]MCB1456410.1 shikimate kinase [Nitratireductor sp.]MCB1458456.1 shikimate kinase [Nitratireductor sp.]